MERAPAFDAPAACRRRPLPAARLRLPPATCRPPPPAYACRLPPVACRPPPPAARHVPTAAHRRPPTPCHLPPACRPPPPASACRPPLAARHLPPPATCCLRPPASACRLSPAGRIAAFAPFCHHPTAILEDYGCCSVRNLPRSSRVGVKGRLGECARFGGLCSGVTSGGVRPSAMRRAAARHPHLPPSPVTCRPAACRLTPPAARPPATCAARRRLPLPAAACRRPLRGFCALADVARPQSWKIEGAVASVILQDL